MYSIKELKEGNYQKDSIVVMSGGVDSTIVLIEEARRIKDSGEGNLYVLYHESHMINKYKTCKEKDAICLIIKRIEKDYGVKIGIIYHTMEFLVMEPKIEYVGSNSMLQQSVLWTSIVLATLPNIGMCNINILFGFNMADNFHGYSANLMKKTIQDFSELMHMGNNTINVAFPLICLTKEIIYKKLFTEYYKYYKLTWTCENVKEDGIACEKCVPCITKYNAMVTTLDDKGSSKRSKLSTIEKSIRSKYGRNREECVDK